MYPIIIESCKKYNNNDDDAKDLDSVAAAEDTNPSDTGHILLLF